MAWFSRKKKKNKLDSQTTVDLLIMEQILSDDNDYIMDLATKMISGKPLILNFEQIDVDKANKVLSFISGVVYAIKGHIFEINQSTFLFGNESLYDDNSITEFLNNL